MREASFVRTFQETGSKLTVDFYSSANNLSAQGVDVQGRYTAKVAETTRLV